MAVRHSSIAASDALTQCECVDNRRAETLQQVPLKLTDDETCGDEYTCGFDSNTMLCAREANHGKSACYGDSGGPLQCLGGDGRWRLVGLVSIRKKKCGGVGVYARVATMLHWINTYIHGIHTNKN